MFTKENIFALIGWCFENQEAPTGMRLTKSVTFFMSIRVYHCEAKFFGYKAVETAKQIGRTHDLAWLLVYGIGYIEIVGRNLEKGEVLLRSGLRLYENLKDSQGMMAALRNLGLALRHKKDFEAARQCFEDGLALAKSLSIRFIFCTTSVGTF